MVKLHKKINDKNDLIVVKNTIYSFVIKGGAMVVSLITMPAYFQYFNDERILGVWFTILSMITWIINFDLGIGNGLRNHLIKAIAEKNSEKIRSYISSAYISVAVVTVITSGFFLLIFKKIDWFAVLGITGNASLKEETLQSALLIVFFGIMLQFLLKLISSVLYALQQSAMISLVGLLSNIIILLYLLLASAGDINENLVNIAYTNILAVNIPLLIVSLGLFCTELRGCTPNWKYCKKEYVLDVLRLGGAFFFVQICYMLFINTNEFIISLISGPEYVVDYQAYNRIYTIMGTVSNLALIPVWSAVTKALNEKNIEWIEKTRKKLFIISSLATIAQILLVPTTGILLEIWLNGKVECDYQHAFIFAIFGSLMIWNASYSSIANGMGRPYVQAIVFFFAIIAKLVAAFMLYEYELSWIYIVAITSFGLLIYVIIQHIYINKYIKNFKVQR